MRTYELTPQPWHDNSKLSGERWADQLVPGGVLILDDYGKLSGATRAVDEYFSKLDRSPLLHRIESQGRIAIKQGRN